MERHGVELTRFILMLSNAFDLAISAMALHQTKLGFVILRTAEEM
jgi:hypothetical protein